MKKAILKSGLLIAMSYSTVAMGAVGQSSFEFMLIGSDSRAAAMGEAFTAVSGDPGAPFFNPASLGEMRYPEISFSHISYLPDVTLERLAFHTASHRFKYGGSVIIGRVADIERRSYNPSGTPLGFFSEHNVTASFYWGIPVGKGFSFGNSVKFAYEKLDLDHASAIGFDFGGFYNAAPGVAVGAVVRNLGSRPNFVDKAFDLPGELRVGASYRTGEDYPRLIFSADYIKPEWGNRSSKLNIGAEYNYQNIAFLRAGRAFGYDSRSFSIGGGLAYRDYFIDYAYIPLKNNLGNSHRLTLRARL